MSPRRPIHPHRLRAHKLLHTRIRRHTGQCIANGGRPRRLGAIVDLLDRAKISIDATDGMGLTALHVATITSQVDAAQLLLTRGASPHKRAAEFQNGTALHAAAHEGNVKMARVLLAAGAPVGATDDDGGSALHTAVTAGDAAVTRLLLDAGAPVDLANGKGSTAIHLASQFGNDELIRVLVAGGADVNALAIGSGAGRTALHVAAFGGKIGAVRALIESGASFARSRLSGGTPLDDAICLAGHQSRQMIFTAKPTIALQIATDLLSSLDAAREAAAAPHPWQGQTPLHAVAYRNVPGSAPAMVELLKSYGALRTQPTTSKQATSLSSMHRRKAPACVGVAAIVRATFPARRLLRRHCDSLRSRVRYGDADRSPLCREHTCVWVPRSRACTHRRWLRRRRSPWSPPALWKPKP